MRRTTKIAAVAVVAALALTGCGKKSDSSTATGTGTSDDVCKTASGDGPKVGLAYDVGGRGDQSFNDSAYAGVSKAVTEFDGTCIEGEAQDGEPESAREDRLTPDGRPGRPTAIIGVGLRLQRRGQRRRPQVPRSQLRGGRRLRPRQDRPTRTSPTSPSPRTSPRSWSVWPPPRRPRATHVGFVGGVHIDLIKTFEAGYTAGVKAVDPSIKVDIAYIQESNLSGFNDPAGGKTAAAGEFDKGADVVYHAAGASGSAVSSTPRSRPATASGRSGSTPTSTSPPPPTRSRTS